MDVSDLGILATNYVAGSGFGWADGDFTGDGEVDVSDLGDLATYYGQTLPPATSSTAAIAAAVETVPCDLNNDGRVGLSDLSLFSSVYGEQPGVTTDSPLAYLGPLRCTSQSACNLSQPSRQRDSLGKIASSPYLRRFGL